MLIQECFKSEYSVEQRFATLTARELAALPTLDNPAVPAPFASRTLPAALHRKYLSPSDVHGDASTSTIAHLTDSVTSLALTEAKTTTTTAAPPPTAARERRMPPPPVIRLISPSLRPAANFE